MLEFRAYFTEQHFSPAFTRASPVLRLFPLGYCLLSQRVISHLRKRNQSSVLLPIVTFPLLPRDLPDMMGT